VLALQALTPERLAAAVPEVSLAEARKLVAQVHRGEPIHPSSSVRRTAAEAVQACGWVPTLDVVSESASAIDPFVKYLLSSAGWTESRGEGDGPLRLSAGWTESRGEGDGPLRASDRFDAADRFEAVRIPLEVPGRFTVCVSSQVGCALACAFCATGRMGLRRNLEAWEIVEQVRIVRARLANHRVDHARDGGRDAGVGRVHGVVFQGMGEPLANLDNVLCAIAVMTDPCALGIDARAITVCTAGLPTGIRRLAREAPNVRLGLSVSSAIAAHRKRVMPIADKHDFDDVIDACIEHARATGHAPMWAVTLLAGVNDSDADAQALADRARAFAVATGKRPRITLLDYNPIGDIERDERATSIGSTRSTGSARDGDTGRDPFTRSTRLGAFRDVLSAAGLASHRRYSGGSDVAAACGQLAATR